MGVSEFEGSVDPFEEESDEVEPIAFKMGKSYFGLGHDAEGNAGVSTL